MREYMDAAKGSLATVEEFAAGIVQLVETSMEKAIRVISVERGHDPRDFTLVAFGGGGPLHGCALARALSVPRVLVPALPGALSAVGILLADTTREFSRTVLLGIEDDPESHFAELEHMGREEFAEQGLEGEVFRSVDLRYRGQGYELNVSYGPEMAETFHALHKRRYGFAHEERPVEIVNVRVRLVAAAELFEMPSQPARTGDGSQALVGRRQVYFHPQFVETRFYERAALCAGDVIVGPAMISEYSSATLLPPGDILRVDVFGNLLIEVNA